MKSPLLLGCLAGLLLTACASAPSSSPVPSSTPPAPVVMLSIDGLNPAALGRGNSPHLDRLAREGVQARWMQPSYPAVTFPNHYTLATGMRPDRHGIIQNSMEDPQLGRFELQDRDAVSNGAWWNDALPLWVRVSRHGLRSAVWSFPGGEAAIDGQRPDLMHPYDESVPPVERARQIVDWLSAPDRPDFVAGYFEHVDQAGHYAGPSSELHAKALRHVDEAIGELMAGLAAKDLLDRVNLVIVSDHGMAEVANDHFVVTENMVPATVARAVSTGQIVHFAPLPGQTEAAEAALLGRHERYECWRRTELPAKWDYGTHRRIQPIVCQMDEGWDAVTPAAARQRLAHPRNRGSHGYDPSLPSMRAVFIARGPAFRQGAVIDPIDNVDVFPLVHRVLGLPIPPSDGNPAATDAALR